MPFQYFLYGQQIAGGQTESLVLDKELTGFSDPELFYVSAISIIRDNPRSSALYDKLDRTDTGDIALAIASKVGQRINIAPLLNGKLLVPITLCYGNDVMIELPPEISSTTTLQELQVFLIANSKIYLDLISRIIHKFQKFPLYRTLLDTGCFEKIKLNDNLTLKLRFIRTVGNQSLVMSDRQAAMPLDCTTLTVAPILRYAPNITVYPPTEDWFNAELVLLRHVCDIYLGSEFFRSPLLQEKSDLFNPFATVIQFCLQLQLYHRRHFGSAKHDLNLNDKVNHIATAIYYYCVETQQQALLKDYPALYQYVLIPIAPQEIYKYKLPIIKDDVKGLVSVEQIADQVFQAHSSFSLLPNSKHDTRVLQVENKLRYFKNEFKGRPNQHLRGSDLSNLLLAELQEEALLHDKSKDKFDPDARAIRHFASAINMTQLLPRNLELTQYQQTFFFSSLKQSLNEVLTTTPSNLIMNYLGKDSYLTAAYAIPEGVLTQIVKVHKDQEFTNYSMTHCCDIILQELHLSAKVVSTMVGPERIGESWSLKSQLDARIKNTSADYIYFALPTRGNGKIGHAVAVIVDTRNTTIYCIDPESNRYRGLEDAIEKLTEVISEANSIFHKYKISHPPLGQLRQQTRGYLCGVYFVMNVISIITQLDKTDITPHTLGLQISRLLTASRIDLEHWTQEHISYTKVLKKWKDILVLTTLDPEDLELHFLTQLASGHQEVVALGRM